MHAIGCRPTYHLKWDVSGEFVISLYLTYDVEMTLSKAY